MEKHIFTKLRLCLIALLLELFFFTPRISYATNILDMSNSQQYNIRFDGAGDLPKWTYFSDRMTTADLDQDGKQDLLAGSYFSNGSGSQKGYLYIIYNSLFNNYTGKGNNIDLANSNNWNIRFDGRNADQLNSQPAIVEDMNGDDKLDLLLSARDSNANGITDSGWFYFIDNSLFSHYQGTGNIIDLSNPANYTVRFDGVGDHAFLEVVGAADYDNDDKKDILATSYYTDFNNRTNSGSIYLINNAIFTGLVGTGNVIDLRQPSSYSFRYDGPIAEAALGMIKASDLDNNGKIDLILSASQTNFNSRDRSGSVYVIYDSLIDDYSGIGNNIDLDTPANYNLRFDGATVSAQMGVSAFPQDIDNDGFKDLIIPSTTNFDWRAHPGSIYLIYHSLYSFYLSTGNIIDLATTSNFSVRIDGNTNDWLSNFADNGDFDGDGKIDIIGTSGFGNSKSSGSLYIIYNSSLPNFSEVGKTIDLADSTNYQVRIDGAFTSDLFTGSNKNSLDNFNSDDKKDLFIGAPWANNSNSSYAGSAYIIYNFPHTLSLNSISSLTKDNSFTATGTITASQSVTNIKGVQYSLDNSNFSGTWNDCSATDGTFDSTS